MTFSKDFIKTHPNALPGVMLGLVVVLSTSFGFLLGSLTTRNNLEADDEMIVLPANYMEPASGSIAVSVDGDAVVTKRGSAQEVGRLQAEILRLQVLFLRLAEFAGLDDGEFDLDSEPLSSRAPLTPDTLKLVKLDLDHMLDQGSRMLRIFKERVARHQNRISGTPVENRTVSSRFGFRADPDTGESRMHRGVDFPGFVGEPILAIASGVVTYAGANGGYGNLVELEHANGYRTRYAHNDKILVALGAVVTKGQQIATLGSSGRSTGPHLHFEVRHHDQALDPQYFIR